MGEKNVRWDVDNVDEMWRNESEIIYRETCNLSEKRVRFVGPLRYRWYRCRVRPQQRHIGRLEVVPPPVATVAIAPPLCISVRLLPLLPLIRRLRVFILFQNESPVDGQSIGSRTSGAPEENPLSAHFESRSRQTSRRVHRPLRAHGHAPFVITPGAFLNTASFTPTRRRTVPRPEFAVNVPAILTKVLLIQKPNPS